jgi:hypothetical protein
VVRGECFGRESRGVESCLCLTKGSQEGLSAVLKSSLWLRIVRNDFANDSKTVFDVLRMLRISGRELSNLSPLLGRRDKKALTSSGEGITSIVLDVPLIWGSYSRI